MSMCHIWIRTHPRTITLICLGVIGLVCMFFSTPQRNQHFEISFLSVGQGDAVLMEIPGGNRLLYDAGPPGGGVLRALEAKLGPFVRTLDVVVLSHPDMDHIGGFPALCERYHIDLVIVSGAEATHGADDASSECIKKKGIQQLVAKRGMQIELGGEVFGDILFPDRDASKMETNSASIVLRVTQGSSTALFSGDLPSSLEEYLVALGAPALDVDLIKLGHHGSRTSTDMSWLHATTPSLAVYSAGKDNAYGHPHEEVLDRLESLRIPYLGTDQEGTVTLRSNQEGFTRVVH